MILCSKHKRKIGDNIAGTDVYIVSQKIKPAWIVIVAVVFVVFFASSLVFGTTVVIKNSDSYKVAIAYIETSEEVRNIVGNITGYGFFVQGGVSVSNEYENANFTIRIIGENDDFRVMVWLERSPGMEWEVVNLTHQRQGYSCTSFNSAPQGASPFPRL